MASLSHARSAPVIELAPATMPQIVLSSRAAFLGGYRLLAELSRGGMADVYLGAKAGLGGVHKLVVIKALRDIEDPEASRMFLDEARLAARIHHPNVVQTFDAGREGDRLFIVMEYLDGPTLQKLRRYTAAKGGVPLRLELTVLSELLKGLHVAHELKGYDGRPLELVHRDLTPHNVIVTCHGECKIVDFGIAKAADSSGQTASGVYKGKLGYMAPEQLRGQTDRRADLFSAGVMLWEAIARQSFWKDCEPATIAHRLLTGDLPALAGISHDAPPALVEVCETALRVNPAARFPSALAFKGAVDRCLTELGGPAPQEELGAFVSEAFASRRAKVREIVEAQLARPSQLPSASALLDPTVMPFSTAEGTESQRPVSTEKVRSAPSPSPPPAETPAASSDATARSFVVILSPRRLRAWIALSVVLPSLCVVALTLVSVPLLRGRTGAGPFAAAESSSTAEGVATAVDRARAGAGEDATPEEVELTVRVLPLSAELWLDGVELPSNPFRARFPKDERLHSLKVRAPGHQTVVRGVKLDSSQLVSFTLPVVKRAAESRAAQPTRKPARRGPRSGGLVDPWARGTP